MDNTPYDDVFRTLLTDCTELMIPVVNEIFHTDYTGKETICLLQNEHFIKMPNGSEQERITDSSFEIIRKETSPELQIQLHIRLRVDPPAVHIRLDHRTSHRLDRKSVV